jgi:hypothetical protein
MMHKNNQSKPRENTRVLQSMVTLSQNKAQTGAPRDEAKRLIPSTKSMGLALTKLTYRLRNNIA